MSVQILIGALLTGDVPSGYGRIHTRATVGDAHRLLPTTTPHPVSIETLLLATKACRLGLPAYQTAATLAVSSHTSSHTLLFRPMLRHTLMPPGI